MHIKLITNCSRSCTTFTQLEVSSCPSCGQCTFTFYELQLKLKLNNIALHGTTSHSYSVSLPIQDHTVLPVTRHKWTRPR